MKVYACKKCGHYHISESCPDKPVEHCKSKKVTKVTTEYGKEILVCSKCGVIDG